jgi:streptogramin lyase
MERFLYGPNDFGKTVLRNPQGMARLTGKLLICDQGYQCLIAVDLESGQSTFWGDPDHAPRCPVDVAVADDGRVYVADTTRRSILVYDENETFVRELTQGEDTERSLRPVALAMRDNVLFVANVGNRRVDRWDPASQEWLSPLTKSKGLGFLAPCGLCSTPAGELLVADSIQGVIHRLSSDGEWLEPIGSPGRMQGELIRPKQICCTDSGRILVADAGRQSVVVFEADGGFLAELNETSNGWRGWTLPTGLFTVGGGELSSVVRSDGLMPDDWVIVSDPLNERSLTLIGVFAEKVEPRSDAK